MCPLVSIIIPCYNAEQLIEEAIHSALHQTYSNVEVIVIDDGSRDRSLDVVRSFGDQIRWETGPNRGACAARNRGLQLSRGEFIQFLDADDLLHSSKLERQLAELLKSKADLIFCHGTIVDDPHHTDDVYQRSYDGGDPVEFVLGGLLPTPSVLHRKINLTRVGGFREDLSCAQERDLHLRLACEGLRFHQLPEVLYTVRRVSGSVSSNWVKVLDERFFILTRAFDQLASNNALTDGRHRAFSEAIARDGRANLSLKRWKEARKCFRMAALWDPSRGLDGLYRSRWRLLAHRVLGPVITTWVLNSLRPLRGRWPIPI